MCIEGSRIWSVGLSQQCLWGRCISAPKMAQKFNDKLLQLQVHDEWMGSVQVIIDREV